LDEGTREKTISGILEYEEHYMEYKYIKYSGKQKAHKRSRKMPPLTRKRITIVVGIGVALLSINLISVMRENYKLDTWIADLKNNVDEQQNKNQQLKDELEYVSTLNYHVKKAKDYLNMKEPGEQVIDVQSDKSTATLEKELTKEEPTPVVKRSNSAEWSEVFWGKEPYVFQ